MTTSSTTAAGGDSTAKFLKTTALKRENVRQTLEAFHTQSNTLAQLASQWKDLEDYFATISGAIAKREDEIEVMNQQIEWKQKYLNKKSSDVELKSKKLEESLKMADERFEMVEKWFKMVLEREKDCDQDIEAVRCKKVRLRKKKRDLKRKFEELELKFEAKELLVDNLKEELGRRGEKLNFIERKLLERLGDVELREKRVRDFERKEKLFGFDFDVDDDENCDPSYADLRFRVIMDGRALQNFLNGRVNDHEILRDEIITGLGMSADPAKLVLDAMQGFYPEELGEEGPGFDLDVVRKSCVLLLEQLSRMKPRIKPRVRERAMKVAMEWKGKMKLHDVGHYFEGLGFLLIVATYGLTCEFSKDELGSVFGSCAKYDGAPELCTSLGLLTEDVHGISNITRQSLAMIDLVETHCQKILHNCIRCRDKTVVITTDIIQKLIIRDQSPEALRLIYAFELVNKFPPVPILKSHLTSAFHRAEEVCKFGDPSIKLQIKCLRKKLSALVSVVRCIKKYGLESMYPTQPLEQQISEFKSQKKYKSLPSASKVKSNRGNKEFEVTHRSISSSFIANTSNPAMESFIDKSFTYDSGNSPSPMPSPIMTTYNATYDPEHSYLAGSASLNAQTLHRLGNKQPRLASSVVAEDCNRWMLPPIYTDSGVCYWLAPSSTWGSYGAYTPSPYFF